MASMFQGDQARMAMRIHKHRQKLTIKPVNAALKRKLTPTALLGIVAGITLFCMAFGTLGTVIYAMNNPHAFGLFSQTLPTMVQPVVDAVKPENTPKPDVEKSDQQQQSEGLDSACPTGAPKFDFRVPNVARKEWFAALPTEPPEGVDVCVIIKDYQNFLLAGGTWTGPGPLNGRHMTGLEILAYHYSALSVGDDSRVQILESALQKIEPGTMNGQPVQSTGWVTLPGYFTKPSVTPVPICNTADCFRPDNPNPTITPTIVFTPTPMIYTPTPQPTMSVTPLPMIDMRIVPTLIPPNTRTPVPQHATAQSNMTVDDWMWIYEQARKYQSEHCKVIDNSITIGNWSTANQIWSNTTQLEFRSGDIGWYVVGSRRDVYVSGTTYDGTYPIYAFCGQIGGMPSWQNIDGNGTSWGTATAPYGLAFLNPPGTVDAATGLVKSSNGTYWANLNGVWVGPVHPKPSSPTYVTLTIDQAINFRGNGVFADWWSYTGGYPSTANPKILMYALGHDPVYIDFTPYLAHINYGSGGEFSLQACDSQQAQQYGGYAVATKNIVTDNGAITLIWCIVPGK